MGSARPARRSAEPAPELSPEEQAQLEAMQAEMEQVRQQLLVTPAVGRGRQPRHGHLRAGGHPPHRRRPKLAEASLAIDALAALVEGLEGRLGEAEPTLREALAQLRAAYLEVRDRRGGAPDPRGVAWPHSDVTSVTS